MKRAGKTFSCPWLLIHWLFNKRTIPIRENSCKLNCFIDGKYSMENFNITDLRRFSWLGKPYRHKKTTVKVCTISFEQPVNYFCDAWHVFPPKHEAWTHFNRPWTEYQCQGVVWTLLIILTESVNRSTCLSVYLIITRLRNVNLLCFSDSIEGIDFLNCKLKCPVTLKLANQNRYFY